MKQPKRPTRDNKVLMSKNNLNAENWMVLSENKAELILISKRTGRRRTLTK